jgi:hypothetical protein
LRHAWVMAHPAVRKTAAGPATRDHGGSGRASKSHESD